MIKMIKKQFLCMFRDTGVMLALGLGGFAFGKILMAVIMRFDQTAETYFPLGTLLASLMMLMYAAINGCLCLTYYFRIEISMGAVRKEFLPSFYLVSFLENMAGVLVIMILNWLDNFTNERMFSGFANEIDFFPWILRYGFLVMAGVTLVGGMVGTMIMKFGRKAGWTFWALWMVGCFVLPNVHSAAEEVPGSILGKAGLALGKFLTAVPIPVWVVFSAAAAVLCVCITWEIIRKQQVTI